MTRRLLTPLGVAALSALITLGACSNSGPASPGAGSTATAASVVPSGPTAGSTATAASGVPSGPTAASTADPILGAKFPETIAGQPVTNLQTFHFLDLLTSTGTSSAVVDRFVAAAAAAGINPRSVNLGTAQVMVGDQSILLQALRAPGSEAGRFMKPLVAVAQQRGIGARASPRDIALSPSNVGGKSVQVARSADLTQYYYPTGDTVFILNNVDAATATTVMSALP